MLVKAPNGSYEVIDYRETAPAAAFEDMYRNQTWASVYSGLARYGTSPCGWRVKLTQVLVVSRAKCVAWNTSIRTTALSPGLRSSSQLFGLLERDFQLPRT